jgi:phosphomannomutase
MPDELTNPLNSTPAPVPTERAVEIAKAVFAEAAVRAKSTKPENLTNAVNNIHDWLTQERFKDYHEALLNLIEIAEADREIADELYDSFYRVMPFGTGGRRSKVGIGPNRMNAYMAAMTAQGDAEFIIRQQAEKETPVTATDLFIGAWDVREFHRYFAETPALERYRSVIDTKCPALSGLSSEDLSEIAALVYAGNGIRYLHPCEMRPTPWLSLFINAWGRIAAKKPFCGVAAILNQCRRVLGGIVLSSSHNPYDNNGTKFYEMSGAQTPPHIVDVLQRIGDAVREIKYFGGDSYYREGRKAAFEAARKSGMVVILDHENLCKVDDFYIHNSIREIKSLYTAHQWKTLTTPRNQHDPNSSIFGQLMVSFNALNGTGSAGILKILESAGFSVLRSPDDTPNWEFTEGYGNVPNPEAEKTFNTGMQIGVRRTLDALLSGDLRGLASISTLIDEDGRGIPYAPFSSAGTADEVISQVRATTDKYIRGLELIPAGASEPALARLKDHLIRNNICLLTDPDADRIGLGMQVFSAAEEKPLRLHWVSANDNDESGIVLFRGILEHMLDKAERGELIQFIENRRNEDGNPAGPGRNHQLVFVNTVVSNPLEAIIAERISKRLEKLTVGRVSVKILTHHVGFKFTGEIIDNIKLGNAGLPFDGITGELMTKAGIKGKDAFFVMSSEEGEGSLIGYRGSIDKDSGVTGLALAVLTAEQQGRGMTLHEYLMETYDRYGYSKASLEPMVMTGEYGMTMINDNIMGDLRDRLLPAVMAGQRPKWPLPGSVDSLVLTGGIDHIDLMKKRSDDNPALWTATKLNLPDEPAWWPVAIRESINILEFSGELVSEQHLPEKHRIRIQIVMRPSGTEPKHKNMVKVMAPPRNPSEETINEYIGRINSLSRSVLDSAMIYCYEASRVEYDSKVVEEPGRFSFADLATDDRLELLRIFPIIVSTEAKLAIYFPLRKYLQKEAARLARLRGTDLLLAYERVRGKVWSVATDGSTKGYLTNFNKTNGIEFVEESVRMNLARQLAGLNPGDSKMAEIYLQTVLWFGPDVGLITFEALLTNRVDEARGRPERNDPVVQAEVGKIMDAVRSAYGGKPLLTNRNTAR